MEIKVLSSIPGRLRLQINPLRNENVEFFFDKPIQFPPGILLVSPNRVTSRLLVRYDPKLVCTQDVLDWIASIDMNDVSSDVHKDLKSKKYPVKVYQNEFALSKRLLFLSGVISCLALCFTFSLKRSLSLLILGLPGGLFLLRRAAYKITQKHLNAIGFYFEDPNLLYEIAAIKHLLIEDVLFFPEVPLSHPLEMVIKRFRSIGLLDINMLSHETSDTNSYTCYQLGINEVIINQQHSLDKKFLTKTASIVNGSDYCQFLGGQMVMFRVSMKIDQETQAYMILFDSSQVHDLSHVIQTSKYIHKLVIGSENSAVALNTIGFFLAAANLLTPLWAIALCFLNYLVPKIYLNNQIAHYEEAYIDEVECSKFTCTRKYARIR
ncbi:MAG: hypothetical protein H7X94_00915 [Vallitaleaceae bacterium]|nr:hypothetical protein [Vallitaleaceae bacterium]